MTWMFDHEDVEPWAATYLVYGLQLLRCHVAKQDFSAELQRSAGWLEEAATWVDAFTRARGVHI